jgi:hypothetical protein
MTNLHNGLDRAAVGQTAAAIAAAQLPSGAIPWFPDGQIDPWDHVEAAMGLDVAGRHDKARAAYLWLRDTQNADGSWCRSYRRAHIDDPVRDANFSAYLAVGLLHHVLTTGDRAFLERIWPTVVAAMDFVLGLQQPGGEIRWARSPDGTAASESLLTGCASMFHSLRCALELARLRGESQPDWELAAATLGHAVQAHAERFSPRDRYSMDWYYPILGGVLRGPAAGRRIDDGWATFVVPGLGVRCVCDHPWVTGAETCELVIALCAVGDHDRAGQLFADIQHLRTEDGSYWTGYVYPDDAFWPEERSTWTAGAVLLASAVLAGDPATTNVFTGTGLPVAPHEIAATCDDCPSVQGRVA